MIHHNQYRAGVLGCENTPQAIEKAVAKATPEQLTEIKKAELDFEARMKELDVDLYALQTQDTADARKHFAKDWTARFLAVSLCLLFAGYILLVTILPHDRIGIPISPSCIWPMQQLAINQPAQQWIQKPLNRHASFGSNRAVFCFFNAHGAKFKFRNFSKRIHRGIGQYIGCRFHIGKG